MISVFYDQFYVDIWRPDCLFTFQFSQVDKSKQIFIDSLIFQERCQETKELGTEHVEKRKSLVYCKNEVVPM